MAGRTAPMRNYLDVQTSHAAKRAGRNLNVLDYVCLRMEQGATLADLTNELREHCLPEGQARRHIGASWITHYLRRLYGADTTDARLAQAETIRTQLRNRQDPTSCNG